MNSEIYIIKKIIVTNPKQQAFVAGAKYRAQNARHKQGVQSIGVPFLPTNSLNIVSKLSTN